ncbi:MAG: thymidine phosphorylase [Spirochaetaceae bacterium]|jgi:pyrimidine-nucleoside phosphorylase|nr:thymidine phosphorylase [Spirochaetaceae bacterium]
MRAVDIIREKRSGKELSKEELAFLINGYVAGEIPDYQVAAWAMAVFFQGMTPGETASLTEVMVRSGAVLDLSGIPGPFVDKHSTGGVGDKTSLILAPLAASLGMKDPMMSGRALGHTGGTLDKLDSIPGYRTNLSAREFRDILRDTGFAMTGQTADIVPADRLLYALRDVTGTVESVPLITASILSKKVAEGTEALVLDVKYGSGAFMKEPADAEKLALSLTHTGAALGIQVAAILTDMNEPLGRTMGNFLEVEECLDCLEGAGAADLMEVTLALGARMAVLGGKAGSVDQGLALCAAELASGRPRERFLANVAAQGGDAARLLALRGTYRSAFKGEVAASGSGFIAGIDAGQVGHTGVILGVGRNRADDTVSPVAGVEFHKKRGDPVSPGEKIMTLWARDADSLAAALPRLGKAVRYSPQPPAVSTQPPAVPAWPPVVSERCNTLSG